MTFGLSSCLFHCSLVVVTCLLASVRSQDITMSPPNTEGWMNPDDFFSPRQASKSADVSGNDKLAIECQENLKVWAEKYADCEKSLQDSSLVQTKDVEVSLNEVSVSCPVAQCEEKIDGAKVYLQRFISKLLEVSNLDTGDMEMQNTAEIKIFISDEQLMTFRQFAKEGKIPLRKLDEIFAAVFVKPYFNLPKAETLLNNLPSLQIGSFFLSVSLPAVWFLSFLLITRSISKSFTWLLPVVFVTSFLTTAYRMSQEAQLKQYEQMNKFPDIPSDCQENRRWPSFFGFSLGTTNCAKYLVAHHIDPDLHITPVKVLTKMFGETVSDTMENIGVGSVGFFNKFSEYGFFTQMMLIPFGCGLLYLIGILISLVITGGSIRLPYFLGSVNFNNSKKNETVSSNQNAPQTSSSSGRPEAAPSTSNITFNFNNQLPPNVHAILQSISQGAHPLSSVPGAINAAQHRQLLPTSSAEREVGAGDSFLTVSEDNFNDSGASHKVSSRAGFSIGSRKFHKQFSQLEARYKAGGKSVGKFTKARKMSL